ncbi:uncharacterized protein N7482_006568 [Penicillium canariense]|uniref:AT hook, DNA-binding motif protein n=1 Tax=Penicillium canariense TaxID=189055 RepID=A0A9W9HWL0_9EURO|nr:uncharacterized protein N7482_006568 [Penicillium canariense]KAJ5159564.1 hypothetical protein N7482_006568 [Penicillium canariense]
MGWDQVIQDSDEDEPLMEDEAPTSIGPLQGHESPKQQLFDNLDCHVAEQQARYPIDQPAAREVSTEPQLSVNFDQFLQSQELSQSAITSSQLRREERWIPSTGDGGGGSIGAMMTEIGRAQRRLLNDDSTSSVQPLPSTATPYQSEISLPGSFPTLPTYQYQHTNETVKKTLNDNFAYSRPALDASYEATQLVPQIHTNIYEYSTPADSNDVELPYGDSNERAATFSTSVQPPEGVCANQEHKLSQRSKSMQSQPWSPHDTEPLSSVVSPGLNRSKSENAKSALMSPQHSPTSAYDELSLSVVAPVTALEPSTVKKKRGRPKKHSLPEHDEDDELAAPRDYGFELSKAAEKRRPGRPRKNSEAATGKTEITEIAADGDEPSNNEVKANSGPGLMVVLPVALGGLSKGTVRAAESGKWATKEPKKMKVKRSKTASTVLDKSHGADFEDDVIWVDSRPLQVDENNTAELVAGAPLQAQNDPNGASTDEAPGPKKRGRKRKKTAEQLGSEAAPASKDQQQPPEAEATASNNAPTDTSTLNPDPEPQNEPTEPVKEDNPRQPESTTFNTVPCEPLPQTPQPTKGKDINSTTAKDSHKGPTKHSPILSTTKVPYRVGLSKRARIAPLLKVVRK